jgi:hypothetical protein
MIRSFSVLCPTRGRPYGAEALAQTALETASDQSRIEVIFGIDDDDPQLGIYKNKLNQMRESYKGNLIKYVIGKRKSISLIYNDLAELSRGDLLMIANDDLTFRSRHWDEILSKASDNINSSIFCIYGKDGISEKWQGYPAFPNVTRRYYEVVGYLTPGIFQFYYNDTWVNDVSRQANSQYFEPNFVQEHLHPHAGTRAHDQTTADHFDDPGKRIQDRFLLHRTKEIRRRDALRLRKAIEQERVGAIIR